MRQISITKEEIIAEYLAGGTSFRKLENKYDIAGSTIAGWVLQHRGKLPSWRERMKKKKEKQQKVLLPPLPEDVHQLQARLRKAELHNKILEEILRLSEEHTGLDLRKKFGTRQS